VPDPTPQPDALSEAKDYARIRAAGGLTQAVMAGLDRLDPTITSPDLAIVETLVDGTSLLLCALDEIEREMAQAA
jgi:hypothetical protein